MLDRTAGCLESGPIRRLLPGSKSPLKRRRALHSGFWNHGAFDLELSPLYTAVVHGTDAVDRSCEGDRPKTSTGPAGPLLEFLYPAGTIRFLRQYSGWQVDKQGGGRSIAAFAKLGRRLYTSSAEDPSTEDPSIEDPSTADQNAEVAQSVPNSTEDGKKPASITELMALGERSNDEEVWHLYSLLDVSEQERLRLPLIEYLYTSKRVVNAERTIELFERLNENDKSQHAYQAAIEAYLRLENLHDASKASDAALTKYAIPVGSDCLLEYTIERSLWSHAFTTWQKYRDFQAQFPETPYDILSKMSNLPTLITRTFDLVDYVSGMENTPDLIEFASTFVRYLVGNPMTSDRIKFNKLLQILERWGLNTDELYQESLERLVDGRNEDYARFAVELYRKARHKDVKFEREVLHEILRIFCIYHSVMGMQQVMDDFFRFHERPTPRAYQLCMTEFASKGDADVVHALFDQFMSRFQVEGEFDKPDAFAPLLQVHALRGELAATLDIFNGIRDRYHLEPTIICWNIVLNAYSKVHDVDGAYAFFEELLQTPGIQPNDYTFGTMLGICATLGDRERAVELYKLADSMNTKKTTAMIDPLVLTFIKDEYLNEAEKLCEASLHVELKGSRTRMWNQLLVAYAMRRDLPNVNRLLSRMFEVNIDYDHFTYSALMQALVMVKQPQRARLIMKTVMKEAGIKPSNFHYAVLMGGYLTNGEDHNVYEVEKEMENRSVRPSASTQLLTLKAAAAKDKMLSESGMEQRQPSKALQIFQEAMSKMDVMNMIQPATKGFSRLPRDIAYSSMFNSFIMFVLSERGEYESVSALYEQYLNALPESRRGIPPVQVLSALMISKTREKNYVAAQECWDLALSTTRERGRSRPPLQVNDSSLEQPAAPGILPDHKLALSTILTTQMTSLAQQNKIDEIPLLVNSLLEEGFLLSNVNWNDYITLMAQNYRYKLAFELCETILMPNWTGWARLRWQAPERNRLPYELRNLRQMPKHYRPKAHTLLYLARGYMELRSLAAESQVSQDMLAELERLAPKTIHAIKTMQRSDDALESSVLGDFAL